MKHIYTLCIMLFIGLTVNSQIETEITNFLNLPCDFTICDDIQLGACPGDLNSQGEPYVFTDFQVYYATENVIIEYNSLTLRNNRLELRNGANLVDNGILIDIQGDCNEPNQITEIVFLGGGNRYASVEEMNATLGIKTETLTSETVFNLISETYVLYNTIGQKVYSGPITTNTKTDLKQFSGLHFLRVLGYNNTIKISN